ncbi:glycoside hydrolase domain-containing protein, partial [Kitasatospora sp. NPDC093558]|uniref:glycoside hydrolase domain-containing protein n=1 Tax=Kitasatospora sp. NPDC093558 TaxID=3155201 RepID=UPI0034412863
MRLPSLAVLPAAAVLLVLPGTAHGLAPSRAATPPVSLPAPLPEYRYSGAGFDACTAPPLEALSVWRTASPYGAVNIYSSGGQRGCAQPRLTPQWVAEVRAMGWKLVPTHVGLQAPCAERAD